jgi:PilZ domain
MIDANDRRVAPRQRFADEAATYLGGAHLDAKPFDISVSGMFLKTPHLDNLNSGAIVGVAMAKKAGFEPPLFLTGRVVRHQEGRRGGVGLQWIRAATTGNVPHLLHSLEVLFNLPSSNFTERVHGSDGRMKATYEFPQVKHEPSLSRPHQSVPEAPANRPVIDQHLDRTDGTLGIPDLDLGDRAPEVPTLNDNEEIGLTVSEGDLGDLAVRVVHDAHGATGRSFRQAFKSSTVKNGDDVYQAVEKKLLEAEELRGSDGRDGATSPQAPSTEPGPRTTPPSGRADVELKARLNVAGVELPGTITGLSSGSLYIESPLAPVDPGLEFLVTFEIKTGDGPRNIFATCTLMRTQLPENGQAPGIIVRVLSTRVPEHKALLGRLAEWIKQQG